MPAGDDKCTERMHSPMNKNTKMVCLAGHYYLKVCMRKCEVEERSCEWHEKRGRSK